MTIGGPDDPLVPIDRRRFEDMVEKKTDMTMPEFERLLAWDFRKDAPVSRKALAWDFMQLPQACQEKIAEIRQNFPETCVTKITNIAS